MNKIIPNICSDVHSFGNNANERKIVVAFLAVDVMDIVKAPKDFVMAAEQLDPKKPVVENMTIVRILPCIDHVGARPSSISFKVPGVERYAKPCRKSPLAEAAMQTKNKAML